MGESPEHLFLKSVAKAFLVNQGCYLLGSEVKLNKIGLNRYSEIDSHIVIDVCGVGLRFSSIREKDKKQFSNSGSENIKSNVYEFGYNILRGIEVKVSRSDFKNGFICSGCNYHYVFTPMRLVASYEVPRGIGLIEFNKYKFACEENDNDSTKAGIRPFRLKGVRVAKAPVFRRIPQFQIDNAIARIVNRQHFNNREKILNEIKNDKLNFIK